jgi:hypothetical protein
MFLGRAVYILRSLQVVVIPPRADVVALAPRAVERAILPPQRMEIGVAGVGTEELMEMGEHRHG